jgi:hypothetical protein
MINKTNILAQHILENIHNFESNELSIYLCYWEWQTYECNKNFLHCMSATMFKFKFCLHHIPNPNFDTLYDR